MRQTHRNAARLCAVVAVAMLGVLAAGPAYAAAPANDTFAGATAIASVPFTTTQDTTEATTDADDTEANAVCGAPALDASVWYSITPATDQVLLVDVSSSSYSAGVLVVTGKPGGFELQTCGPGAVAFQALAGVTYHMLMIDDQYDGAGNGGTLRLSVTEAPPPPELTVTVNDRAAFNALTGSATVSGTIACTGVVDFTFVDVQLRQTIGLGDVVGYGFMEVACDSTVRPWSVEVFPYVGTKFVGGKGASFTFAYACGPIFCSEYYTEQQVLLSRR